MIRSALMVITPHWFIAGSGAASAVASFTYMMSADADTSWASAVVVALVIT